MAIKVTCDKQQAEKLAQALKKFSGKAIITCKDGSKLDLGHVTSFAARNLFQSPSPIDDFDALTKAGYKLDFITGAYSKK